MEKQLEKHFGFSTFKTGQREVIESVMEGRSAGAIFPTGAGKSLCYQLPALLLPNITLVISPLLSLMKDQVDFLQSKNIAAARLDSTLTADEYRSIIERAKSGDLKILMISVERFKNERFRIHLAQMNISLMVVDEAHCISEWGHNFRPDYLKLPVYKKDFGIEQVLLLTATATESVIADMSEKLRIDRKDICVTGFYRENLNLYLTPTSNKERDKVLADRIRNNLNTPTIVYVTLQKTADRVAEFLNSQNISAHSYHAGMNSQAREVIQNKFMSGEITCIVATIAFGMGIDKQDIRQVIHYDLPKSLENYSQEIGRSGRDGKESHCELLANRDGINILENFVYGDTPSKSSICKLLKDIKNCPDKTLEVKLFVLSSDLDIKLLPLKTLLVYLEMNGILSPMYTFFKEYPFKQKVAQRSIIEEFTGERKRFVESIFGCCEAKKVWHYADVDKVVHNYGSDRKRVVKALEYFNEKGWIELTSKTSIDVYRIMHRDFNPENVAEEVHALFLKKETSEVERIHTMIAFFEKESCLNKELAAYFGEELEKDNCGHCSFCITGGIKLERSQGVTPLDEFDFVDVTKDLNTVLEDVFNVQNITKTLCGITSPVLSKKKVKNHSSFGYLEKHPFMDIKKWVAKNLVD